MSSFFLKTKCLSALLPLILRADSAMEPGLSDIMREKKAVLIGKSLTAEKKDFKCGFNQRLK